MEALGTFLQIFCVVLIVAMFVRIIFSWTGFDPSNPLYAIVLEVTEPILAPLRSILPRAGMFDLSPMIALFILFALLQVGARLANS